MACSIVRYHVMGYPFLHQFPGGKCCSLKPGPCFISKYMNLFSGTVGRPYRCKGSSIINGSQCSGIAMRKYPGTIRNKGIPMFPNEPAFFRNLVYIFLGSIYQIFTFRSCGQHPVNSKEQVKSRRSCSLQPCSSMFQVHTSYLGNCHAICPCGAYAWSSTNSHVLNEQSNILH